VELKQIKELMSAMGRTGTKKLLMKKDGFELQLEREENGTFKPLDVGSDLEENTLRSDIEQHRASISPARQAEKKSTRPLDPYSREDEKEDSGALYSTSPMVGTFYASPSPDDPPFVKVGDKVEKGTVVCIIEAMKVMNEVKAGVSGTISQVLVETGHPVEFGTKLFKIV
jgi:acetyl-CoA carboxylase biotin carboxyl carrier protein